MAVFNHNQCKIKSLLLLLILLSTHPGIWLLKAAKPAGIMIQKFVEIDQ
jgi:hypothetical protein